MELLRENQMRMTKRGIKPEEFEDWIIFMSMFNDIDWSRGTDISNDFSNALNIKDYANRFQKGTLVFSRSW